ncbi:MAG: SpoIIE family protein phosphatase [Acidobacteriota bacterium]
MVPDGDEETAEGAKALLGLDSLAEIADTLATVEDFHAQGRELLHQVLGTLLAPRGAIYLHDARRGILAPVAARGIPETEVELDAANLPILTARRDPLQGSDLPVPGALAGDLLAPLCARGTLLGLFRFGAKFMGASYTERDLDLLKVIALNTAVALSHQGLLRTARETSLQLRRKVLEMESLREVGLQISSLLDLDLLCSEILERAVALIAARAGVLLLSQRDGSLTVRSSFGLAAEPPSLPAGSELSRRMTDADAPFSLVAGGGTLPFGAAESALASAVRMQDRVLGAIVLLDKEGRAGIESFGPEDESLLAGFAAQAAVAIENAQLHKTALEQQRFQRELELAAEIQRNLLPQAMPSLPGYEIAALTRPCRTVGGDYYDFLPLPGGRMLIIVADVAGKGVPAALLVFTLNATLYALVGELSRGGSLVDLVAAANRAIYRSSTTNRFITAFFGILDPATGALVSVNAGHNPPVLVSAGQPAEGLKRGGLCLGMFEEARYQEETTAIARGDLLCLYSDGVTEAQDAASEEFGGDRLAEALLGAAAAPAAAALSAVDAAVARFVADAPQFDDLTLVMLRRLA